MNAQTNAEKQKAWRERQKEKGLVREIVWIKPEDRERLRKYVARLNKEGK